MKTTQCDRILRHLKEYGSITDLEAYTKYGIRRLASRIHDLKRRGVDIISERVNGRNRNDEPTHFSVYRLKQ